jgi:flagellar hook-associated protein 3 FlgL
MVERISTAFQNKRSLLSLQEANGKLSELTYQVTSGYKARRLSEIASVSDKILTLRDVQARNEVFQNNITSATNQIKAAETALSQLTDLLASASSLATLGRNENSATTRATMAPKAQSLAEGFYAAYKTQFNGNFVFSGMDGLQTPVAGTAAAAAFPGLPLPTTWYQGDSNTPVAVTGPSTTTGYGVAGDNPAFVKMKAGLEALWYGLQNNNVTEIDNAISVLSTAKTDLSGMQGTLGGQLNTLNQLSDRYTAQQTFTQEQLDGVEKVDVSTALTQFSQQQATMEASMLVISRVNQLSLLDYLR